MFLKNIAEDVIGFGVMNFNCEDFCYFNGVKSVAKYFEVSF